MNIILYKTIHDFMMYIFHGTIFHPTDNFPTNVYPELFQVLVVLIMAFYTFANHQLQF